MVRLLIPTRNRPQSLAQVLKYVARFYPGTSIVIADGSVSEYSDGYAEAVSTFETALDITYRQYDPDLPFFDRILDALATVPDECVAMGADDDFPNMDVLNEGEAFLLGHDDYVTAIAGNIYFNMWKQGELNARLKVTRELAQDSVKQRIAAFSPWPVSTTYAATRRKHLVQRYEKYRNLFVPGFYDFAVGLDDCIAGKIKALDGFGFFATRNFNHSYVRLGERLRFLDVASDLKVLVSLSARDLEETGMDAEEANSLSGWAFSHRIREHCEFGRDKWNRLGGSQWLENRPVRQQLKQFHQLFRDGNRVREDHEERLHAVVAAIHANSTSSDNAGEPAQYGSIAMAEAAV